MLRKRAASRKRACRTSDAGPEPLETPITQKTDPFDSHLLKGRGLRGVYSRCGPHTRAVTYT